MDQWTPATAGAGFEFTPILKPLEPFRESLVVVSNLTRRTRQPGRRCTRQRRGLAERRLAEADRRRRLPGRARRSIRSSPKQIGQDTPFPSLEVATEDFTGYVGACTPGYSCAYMNTISWATPTTPLPMEINPRVVFERLFGDGGRTAAQRRRACAGRPEHSRFDCRGGGAGLQRGLGARDRARVNEYLDNVREIERRIQRTETQHGSEVTSAGRRAGLVRGARRR